MTKEELAKFGIVIDKDEVSDEEGLKLIEQEMKSVRGDLTKNKNLLSERNSEIARYKKEKEDRMSDDEKARLHIENLEKENADYKKTLAKNNKVADYMSIGYPKDLAEQIADAELEGKSTAELHAKFITSTKESLKAELLKDTPNPDVNKDKTSKFTKENFKKGLISMEEMNELKTKDPALYKELIS